MTTCRYCDLPHSGDRCPTMAGQMARLHEAWGQLLAELWRPFDRLRTDAELRRLLLVGALVGIAMLAVLVDPGVLVVAAMAVVAGFALGPQR